jgi:hypothetical protein
MLPDTVLAVIGTNFREITSLDNCSAFGTGDNPS